MFTELDSTEIKDMILDRIIQIQRLDRRWSNELEPETDAIIILLQSLHDRCVEIKAETSEGHSITNLGVIVEESADDRGNLHIFMKDYLDDKRSENE